MTGLFKQPTPEHYYMATRSKKTSSKKTAKKKTSAIRSKAKKASTRKKKTVSKKAASKRSVSKKTAANKSAAKKTKRKVTVKKARPKKTDTKKTSANKSSGKKKIRKSKRSGVKATVDKTARVASKVAGKASESILDMLNKKGPFTGGADGSTAAQGMLGPNPVVGVDYEEMFDGAKRALRSLMVNPSVIVDENINLLGELVKVVKGTSEVAPDPRDKRFMHQIWQKSGYYKRVMQSYLAWHSSVYNILNSSKVSEKDKERARFLMQFVTEAVAPTNTLIGNPGALMRVVETKGKSLLYGARNMLDDIVNNGGMPRMVDESKFQVGKNLAISEGNVVFRNEVLEVIHYKPHTDKVYKRPILMLPPQINKFYMVDLTPGRSFVEFCTNNEVPFFAVSWRNPTAAQRDWSLETYIEASKEAIDAVCEISGSDDLNLMGACAGGFTMATLLAHYAALDNPKIKSSTMMVTVLDTRSETLLGMFASKSGIAAAQKRVKAKGVLEGKEMAKMFAWLRPNDLVWLFVANNWVMGNNPPAFDMLYWNADTTRLPAAFHVDLLNMYITNPLVKPNSIEVLGTKIDTSKITCDTYVVAGITDHITPWKACYDSREILKNTNMKFILSSSGHVQSIINPPGKKKSKYFNNPDLSLDADSWLEGADEIRGTWWFDWLDWYKKEQGGKLVNAPKHLGSDKHPPTDKAPGRYVHQR
ncbi:MAG: alpha/beta fold hydrolase [Gammaproteobacteria bacterium]|nr:alpha/beta fold hydrolase [Gammaproteobacteria bacterium]